MLNSHCNLFDFHEKPSKYFWLFYHYLVGIMVGIMTGDTDAPSYGRN
jgi:hypothetical protein